MDTQNKKIIIQIVSLNRWQEILYVERICLSGVAWPLSNTTSLPVSGQEGHGWERESRGDHPQTSLSQIVLSRARNLLFQWICDLLHAKRYKGMESPRDGEARAAIVAEEEFLAAAPFLTSVRPTACCCAPTANKGSVCHLCCWGHPVADQLWLSCKS